MLPFKYGFLLVEVEHKRNALSPPESLGTDGDDDGGAQPYRSVDSCQLLTEGQIRTRDPAQGLGRALTPRPEHEYGLRRTSQ